MLRSEDRVSCGTRSHWEIWKSDQGACHSCQNSSYQCNNRCAPGQFGTVDSTRWHWKEIFCRERSGGAGWICCCDCVILQTKLCSSTAALNVVQLLVSPSSVFTQAEVAADHAGARYGANSKVGVLSFAQGSVEAQVLRKWLAHLWCFATTEAVATFGAWHPDALCIDHAIWKHLCAATLMQQCSNKRKLSGKSHVRR